MLLCAVWHSGYTLNGIIRMVIVQECCGGQDMAALPPHDQRHLWLRYQVMGYTEETVHDFKIEDEMRLDVAGTLCFQLGGSERLIPDKGDLSDYWVEISSGSDFLRGAPSYTYIRDPVRRLYHRHAKGRKSGARLSRGHFVGRLAHHFDLVSDDGLRGLSVVACELSLIDIEIGRLEEEIQELCRDVGSLRGLVERSMTDQGRVSTWMISCMTQLIEASGTSWKEKKSTMLVENLRSGNFEVLEY
ncbi:hypothetical protein Tco_0465461 [Tanacetum coccineum]